MSSSLEQKSAPEVLHDATRGQWIALLLMLAITIIPFLHLLRKSRYEYDTGRFFFYMNGKRFIGLITFAVALLLGATAIKYLTPAIVEERISHLDDLDAKASRIVQILIGICFLLGYFAVLFELVGQSRDRTYYSSTRGNSLRSTRLSSGSMKS